MRVTAVEDFTGMKMNEITGEIVRAAVKVHSALGPGLLEGAYRACLVHELSKLGLRLQTEWALPVNYDGILIDVGYRVDLLVEEVVIVELKAVNRLMPIHDAQLLSYLKLGRKPVGLIINFHVTALRNGIRRIVL